MLLGVRSLKNINENPTSLNYEPGYQFTFSQLHLTCHDDDIVYHFIVVTVTIGIRTVKMLSFGKGVTFK